MSNKTNLYSVITGTGSYIPENIISGDSFLDAVFYDNGTIIDKDITEIIKKFSEITEINERRYVSDHIVNSDIAAIAAQSAIDDAGIDKESIDHIILCHNFGDIEKDSNRTTMIPALAAKVKSILGIHNPDCVAYDLIFGCPGWVQGVIQADYLLKSGDAKRVMVIGSETLSRIIDPHDRDSMIFSDGAAAIIFEAKSSEDPIGIIAHKSQTFATHGNLLSMGKSYNPNEDSGNSYL